MYKILVVGGTFSEDYNNSDKAGYAGLIYETDYNKTIENNSLTHTYGQRSGLITKLIKYLIPFSKVIKFHNGGKYSDLLQDLEEAHNYDIVFWFANVDNALPKVRNVKEVAPKVMLVTSKRNDNEKYTTMEVVQRALGAKANLIIEFSKQADGQFNSRVLDPLGNIWYNGTDLEQLVRHTMVRLNFLKRMTRQGTTPVDYDKSVILNEYFGTNRSVEIPNEQEFVDVVRDYAEKFHEILQPGPNVKRFLGNCSLRPKSTRCMKGFPSFRKDGFIFVSQRNVDKEFLTLDNFVPTYIDEDENIFYCGDVKPSVDTPVQLRLYNMFPNINYMIHAHVYCEGGMMTDSAIPCGALEEVMAIRHLLEDNNISFDGTKYLFNLKGHGCIIMGNTVEDVKNVAYYGRPMPEIQTKN